MDISRLELLQLPTPDVEATARFYHEVLGAELLDAPSEHWARVRLGDTAIGIHQRDIPVGERGGWEPGFRVDDLASARSALVEARTTITRDYHDIPGGVTLSFVDNAGNSVALYQFGVTAAELTR